MNSLVTEEEAHPGIKVRAVADYCDTFDCPFGAIRAAVEKSNTYLTLAHSKAAEEVREGVSKTAASA